MKTPSEEVRRKVQKWVAFADEDLRFAQTGMSLPGREPPAYRLVAYHAQQCAEKYLKAYLVCQGVDFPYTHNISTLLELCIDYAVWPTSLREAEELTDYAITTRYPGEDEDVMEAEAKRALEIARTVRGRVQTELKLLGMELEE
jgi:HEPN domain-containing protein